MKPQIVHKKRGVLTNMENYTLWLMPCNTKLFPLEMPGFQDSDLRIRHIFTAQDDTDAWRRVIYNQLSENARSGYWIAWKIDRGDNPEPLGANREVDSGVCEPLDYENAVSIMGGPEAAFERALNNLWLGLALAIAMSESKKHNDPEWDNRERIAKEKLRQETDTLESKGWSRGKIAARLRIDPRFLSRMLKVGPQGVK